MHSSTPLAQETLSVLQTRPRLLFDTEKKLVLLWSPLCGSNSMISWFLRQTDRFSDFLKLRERTGRGQHWYRAHVCQRDPGYTLGLPHITDGTYTVIRLVRNPFARCVSSFLHCIRQPAAFPDVFPLHPVFRRKRRHLRFSDYVTFLESQHLQSCDPHYGVQRHPAERAGILQPTHVLQLEHLHTQLTAVEESAGLPHIPVPCFRRTPYTTDTAPAHGRAFTAKQLDCGVPHHTAFFTPALERRVARLYREDFDAYGYSTALQNAPQRT